MVDDPVDETTADWARVASESFNTPKDDPRVISPVVYVVVWVFIVLCMMLIGMLAVMVGSAP